MQALAELPQNASTQLLDTSSKSNDRARRFRSRTHFEPHKGALRVPTDIPSSYHVRIAPNSRCVWHFASRCRFRYDVHWEGSQAGTNIKSTELEWSRAE